LNCTLLLGDGTVLWANQTELNVLGYTAEEYIGKQIMNFCPDERELVLEIFKRLGTGNIIKDVPVRFRTKDGRLVHLLIDSNVAYNRDGSFGHTRCFIRDDTGRKIRDVRTKLLIDENERVCCDSVLRIVTMRISNYPSFLLCAELEDA
jgi:PAS domain S-box-containing protein